MNFKPSVELLEDRTLPTVAAFANGLLVVLGDAGNNAIVVSADVNGNVTVTDNGQVVPVKAKLAALKNIYIDGGKGDDVLATDRSLNRVNASGLFAAAGTTMLGGKGNDTLTVGHGGIVGGLAGVTNGKVTGRVVGNAYMDGGSGNDVLNSGFGNDTMLGGAGDDIYRWLPGTLTDVWDGGAGNDTAVIIGNVGAADAFSLTGAGQNVLFQRTNLIQFAVLIGRTEAVVLLPGSGDDSVSIRNLNLVPYLNIVFTDGGPGDNSFEAFNNGKTGVNAVRF